jgi:F-type H+-transporting ATPase subunit gamma
MWRRPAAIDCIDVAVVTSDRGLCGGFNENLLRAVDDGIATSEDHNISVKLFVIGKKGLKYLKARRYDVEAVPTEGGQEAMASWVIGRIVERYRKGESAGGNIAFNRFESAARQEVKFWNLLPLHARGSERERHMEYLYEPARGEALDGLCMEAMRSSMRQALVESNAAELAARMAAMDNATRNADEMIAHLTFVYNRARQEDITAELMDIVGGAEALK